MSLAGIGLFHALTLTVWLCVTLIVPLCAIDGSDVVGSAPVVV